MDNHFWSDEAARLYKEGHKAKEAIEIIETEKEKYERSKNCVEENMVARAGRISSK